MKVSLVCVGRLGAAPEAALARRYAERATQVGRAQGLGPVEIIEVVGRKTGSAAEGEAILGRLAGAKLVACDEGGEALASRAFALWLAAQRDQGEARLAFAIGGADGLDEPVLAAASRRLAFGPATWPHALARVMLAEQIYRCATILAAGPYHRG